MRTVNRQPTSRPQFFLRGTALILALIFLNISGVTTLTHTDDVSFVMRVHAGANAVSHSIPSGPDFCAACQWENSLFSPHVPAVLLPVPVFVSLSMLAAAQATRFPDPFDHTSPRAPPHASCKL